MKLYTEIGELTDYIPGGIIETPYAPLINILVRTHRPKQIEKCLRSVRYCEYGNTNLIIHNTIGRTKGYDYNLFCNVLKSQVEDGWFFFLDDDDELIPGALPKIAKHLTDPGSAVICQFLRKGQPKPTDDMIENKQIINGKIGMPCIFIHESKKNLLDFGNTEDADYQFIKGISEMLPTKFVKIPVVNSPKRSHGKG